MKAIIAIGLIVGASLLACADDDSCSKPDGEPPIRLVVAMDGTGNKPYNDDGESPVSNVVRLVRGARPMSSKGVPQVVFYNWGIGTEESSTLSNAVSQASGTGIRADILNCYRFLVHNYVPGAEIYLLGFSRGAFSVLSLAGMIEQVGLIPKENLSGDTLGAAYKHYTKHDTNPEGLERFCEKKGCFAVHIEVLGVFDIVKSLGIRSIGSEQAEYHVDYCPSSVVHAFHAVSIDENREDFAPTLLDNDNNKCAHLEEVWFPGVHSDIGGGYEERKISDHAGRAMANAIQDRGLEFFDDYFKRWFDNDSELKLHDHKTWLLGKKWRKIPKNAKFNGLVVELLERNEMDYVSYCNPKLAKVNDPEVSKYADAINEAHKKGLF